MKATEGRKVRSADRDEFEARYPIRDLLLFPDKMIAPFEAAVIEVVPEAECLVQRIVMHRSIAARLVLVQLHVGDTPRTRPGAGSCEIFLSDVPNWAPARLVIRPDAPLRISVRNMVDQGLKISGTVIVGVAELPEIPAVETRPRRKLFGGGVE